MKYCNVERRDGDGQWEVVKTFTGADCMAEAEAWIAHRVTGSEYRIQPEQ